MGLRAWLALAALAAAMQLGVEAGTHKAHAHHNHLRVVIKHKQLNPAPQEPDANIHVGIINDKPADEFTVPQDAVLYAQPIAIAAPPQPAPPQPAPTEEPVMTPLPIFFFHGVTANNQSGFNFNANVTAEGRKFVALSFCQDLCSVSSLHTQVPLAIQQIRATVASDPESFAKGYIFIGHSQGAVIARAVVEEMDDHNVRTLISLAGAQNGIFYGPQASDAIPLQAFAGRIGPKTIPATIFDFSKYAPADYASGKFQSDFNTLVFAYPALQDKLSVMNLGRSPVKTPWRKANTFLPALNNINPCESASNASACETDKARRKANFLKLTSAHFFGSPADDVLAPWQTALLGQYSDVATQDDLALNFALLEPVEMKLTEEYKKDTYGLQALDARGGLFLYDVPDVGHKCWLVDSTPLGKTEECLWQPVFENYVYPVLMERGWGVV